MGQKYPILNTSSPSSKVYYTSVGIHSKGKIIGEEDCYLERDTCNYTVKCRSLDGEVFAFKCEDFIKSVKGNQDTMEKMAIQCIASDRKL